MDDTFGILRQNATKTAHLEFTECLSSVDPRLNFTFETKDNGHIPFLDAHVTRLPDGHINFSVYRKSSNTGLTINPRSNQDPSTWIGVFKGALCRAYRICSTPSLLKEEIDFLVNNFEDNGFERNKLLKIAQEYKPPELRTEPPPCPPVLPSSLCLCSPVFCPDSCSLTS